MSTQMRNTSIIHNIPSPLSLIKTHFFFIFSLVVIAFLIFATTLGNEFAVIDDIAGYIENEQIRSISTSFSSLLLLNIAYSLNYYFFQLNPLPLHVFAILNHVILADLLF